MNINKKISPRLYKVLMTVLILLTAMMLLLFNSSRWVAGQLGRLDVETLIFQLRAPSDGASPDVTWGFIWDNIPSVILILVLAMIIFIRSLKWEGKLQRITLIVSTMGFMMLSVMIFNYIWVDLDVQAFLENQQEASTFIEDHYVDPRAVELIFPEERRNLIHIYLESMETTFMAAADGGAFEKNLIPELTTLARSYINFSPTDQLGGAQVTAGSTWTSAGMFAQTAGLPLDVPVNADTILADLLFLTSQEATLFPSGAVTFGEILEAQGYRQVLMIGSDATFGGRRYYFTENGNYEIWDYHTAIELGLIPEDYFVWWGVEDERLLSFAQDKLLELGSSDQPFNFTLLTTNTHFEDGFVSEQCTATFDVQYANALACSSKQIYAFVRWIQEQPFYENTTIVMTGDHLTMQSLESPFWEAFPVPEEYVRTVYNVFINTPVTPRVTNGRSFTTLDFFPTILASLGVQIEGERLGLGTNLFSEEPTLLEQVGFEEMDRALQRRSNFLESLMEK